MNAVRGGRIALPARQWVPWVVCAALVALVGLQALVYHDRAHLSLGPHVILQPLLIRQGYLVYEDMAEQHSPFMPLLLAAIVPLFPDELTMARIVQVSLLSLTTTLAFVAAVRWAGWLGGLWAALFVVSWSPWFDYGKLWHESFLAPLYVLLLLLYDPAARRRSRRSVLLLGLVGGTAAMFKQYAVVVLAVLVGWNALAGRQRGRAWRAIAQDTLLLGCGALVPLLAFAVYQYARAGTLRGFVYWTTIYNLAGPYHDMAAIPPTPEQALVFATAGLLLPVGGLFALERWRQGDPVSLGLGWTILLVVASSLTAYPRFGAFHLQATLPLLACLSSLVVATAWRVYREGRVIVVSVTVALTLLWAVAAAPYYALLRADAQPPVAEYSELVPLAEQVMAYTAPGDTLYIYPDDEGMSNLYYLTGTSPPKPWIHSYPWFMMDWVREGIMSRLREQPPDWIVYYPERWASEIHAPEIAAYIDSHYRRAAELTLAGKPGWLLRRQP